MAAKREFFSTNEVAQTLGISPFTIRRYIRLRKLKAVKLEGSYRVR
ncbi:MAG: helix-turn-helix domain-containing protein, partial [Acidobacteriota bacterium]